MELQPVSETTVQPIEQRSLLERLGDTATLAVCHAQVKVAGAMERVKQEGGNIAARAALAGLAIAGSAGFMAMESGTAEAAPTHVESGGPSNAGASVSYGWNVYVNFNRQSTKNIEKFQEVYGGGLQLAAAACAPVPMPVRPFCIVGGVLEAQDFTWAVRRATETDECLQMKLPYTALSVVKDPWGAGILPTWGYEPCQS